MTHVFKRLSAEDLDLAMMILGGPREPDLSIAPDGGEVYLYRWHLIPRNKTSNLYFHIQTRSDPDRPLHDHPWDNQTVILANGYTEYYQHNPPNGSIGIRTVLKGDVVQRRAHEAHRLILPHGIYYTMTMFTTGPHRRSWGFWYQDQWVHNKEVCRMIDGRSVHVEGENQWI